MIDVESHFNALKAAWVPRILTDKDKTWIAIPSYYINSNFDDISFLLQINFKSEKSFTSIKNLPIF